MNNFGMLLSLHINPTSNDNLRHLEDLVLKFTNHLSLFKSHLSLNVSLKYMLSVF